MFKKLFTKTTHTEKASEAINTAEVQDKSHDTQQVSATHPRSIGYLLKIGQHAVSDPEFADFTMGLAEVIGSQHCEMVIKPYKPEDELEVYQHYIESGRVDAFLINYLYRDDPRIKLLKEHDFPFAAHGYDVADGEMYDFFDLNNEEASYTLTQHLIELGHRNIAFLNDYEFLQYAADRRRGFERALADAGLQPRTDLIFCSDMSEAYGSATTKMMMLMPPSQRPTAIMSGGLRIARGIYRQTQELGLRVPADLSIATFDAQLSIIKATKREQTFTAVQYSLYEAGKALANMLLHRLDHPDSPWVQDCSQGELVVGSTTAAPRGEHEIAV